MPHVTANTLDKIIQQKSLSVYFQPIIANSARKIFGYEALIRGPFNSPLHSPVALFNAAEKQGRLVELELLCRELSVRQFKKLKLPGKLFLNASPATLFQPDFRSGRTLALLQKVGLQPSDVVIEITEHSPIENHELVHNALRHYKKMGFEIAIDDLGAGYSGLRMWYELRPDYVKIDRHFITDIDSDTVKQHFVHSIKNIARELNCKVIAEGIESEQEFHFLGEMELPFCQGYYLGRPAALPAKRIAQGLFAKQSIAKQAQKRGLPVKAVNGLLQESEAVSSSTTIEQCAALFEHNPNLESIPVLEGNKPIGLLRRNNLANLFFSQYGRELSGKKSIASLLDCHVLILESSLSIEQASGLISEQIEKQKALEFIITELGEYRGVGSVIDLLKEVTDLQLNNARYANPLTLLPGNVPISKELDQRLALQSQLAVCYIDLDHFKPYNDHYGYEKGDQIIIGLADILQTYADHGDFVGHIGGDDFIMIFSADNWQAQCRQILKHFSEWVRHRYSPEAQVMGGITGKDRMGRAQSYPLLSLSIGCVQLQPATCNSHRDVAVLASYAKSMAKKIPGNSLFVHDGSQAVPCEQEKAG